MMCIKNHVDKSAIHGLGVYADEDIAKGTVIWKFNSLIDKVLTQENLESLPPVSQHYVRYYSYKTDGIYVLGGDNGIYFNHSENPNTVGLESPDGYGITVAARNIVKGEELTGDYNEFDDNFEKRKESEKFVNGT